MVSIDKIFASIVQGNGYSITKPRQVVFDALTTHENLTMSELVTEVSGACDRASVYRTIELFESLNIVQRVAIGWKYKLELSSIFRDHHHHAVCTICNGVLEFDETREIETALAQLAQSLEFDITEHSLELQGRCKKCQHA